MDVHSNKVRLEPDKQGYEDAMATFIRTIIATHPRSAATTKIALTTSAQRTFAKEFGVEVNILMTKLYGEERTKFGFDDAPETRHFALKVFGMVYEYGPYEEKIKKRHFLDWYAEHMDFEFATIVDTSFEFSLKEIRRPVVAYTMTSEQEFDEYINRMRMFSRRYNPKETTCFCFVKSALMTLDRNPSPDCEVQQWITKYQESLTPDVRKTLHFITRHLHQYYRSDKTKGNSNVIEQVDLEDGQDSNQLRATSMSCPTTPNSGRKRTAGGTVIAEIDLSSDDDRDQSSKCCVRRMSKSQSAIGLSAMCTN